MSRSNRNRSVSVRLALVAGAGFFLGQTCAVAPVWAQRTQANQSRVNRTDDEEGESSDRRAIAHYADAAAFQNNGAYELAVEEWQKLLKDFPKDPLRFKAWHYLGVCYIQSESPEYSKAIEAFSNALENKSLEVREETLINLSWCLFNQAREARPESREQKRGLESAKQRLTEFLASYADGAYVDQALFYLGEIEYSLGNARRAIAYYKKLLDTRSLAKSSLRPDARYALAVAYEEDENQSQAARQYQAFLDDYRGHRLAPEVSLRLADLRISDNDFERAEQLLSALAQTKGNKMADYAILRLGYVQGKLGQQEASLASYRKLLDEFPKSEHAASAALAVGQGMFQQGQYDEAQRYLKRVVDRRDALAVDATHWLAVSMLRQNKATEATKLLADALSWSKGLPGEVNLQMDYADALYAQPDQLERSRAAYELIANEHADDPIAPRALYNAAFAALQMADYADARRGAESFLSRYPQDPLRNDVAYVAAESLLLDGEHDAAARAYDKLRKADRRNPDQRMWTLRQAMAHYLGGDYRESAELLEDQLAGFESPQQKAEANFILGASYLYLERIADAVKFLQASHRADPKWNSGDEVLLLLAEAHQRNQDKQAARTTLEDLLRKFPNTRLKAQVDYKLAQLSAAMGEYDRAIRRYQEITQDAEAGQFHAFARYGIVWCLMQQEEYQQALRQLQPLLRDEQGGSIGADVALAEGVCLRKLGQLDQAVSSLKRFVDRNRGGNQSMLGNALYELGLALTEKGDLDDANRYFDRILKDVPSYADADKVLYELAWNHQEAGDDARAAAYFQELSRSYPRSSFASEAGYMQAQNLYDREKFADAIKGYRQVVTSSSDPELLEKAIYKLGWCYYQTEQFENAAREFSKQVRDYPAGMLRVDALFMAAECSFKQDRFETALSGYEQARRELEADSETAASEQVKTLIYLHGAQCLREKRRWSDCEKWLQVVVERFPQSPYMATVQYELGFCKQQQKRTKEALAHYSEVAENYRNEIGARSRFMMGEVYFAERDFADAIKEFQRVIYGYGGDKAPKEIQNWQVKSAFEAARCSEVLIESLRGNSRDKVVQTAQDFYKFIVEKHGAHELAAQAQTRLGELQKLR